MANDAISLIIYSVSLYLNIKIWYQDLSHNLNTKLCLHKRLSHSPTDPAL